MKTFIVIVLALQVGWCIDLLLRESGIGRNLSVFPQKKLLLKKYSDNGQDLNFHSEKEASLKKNSELPKISRIEITDDPQKIFSANPPKPLDWALILEEVRNAGAEQLIIEPLLSWDTNDETGILALDYTLSSFKGITAGLNFQLLPTPAELPSYLTASTLSRKQISGEIMALPELNKITFAPSFENSLKLTYGFRSLGTQESAFYNNKAIPLLARWGDHLIPSITLTSVCQLLEIPLSEVTGKIGDHLRLGKSGPYVPLDNSGRAHLTHSYAQPNPAIAAESLIQIKAHQKPALHKYTLISSQKNNTLFSEITTLLNAPRINPTTIIHSLETPLLLLLFLVISALTILYFRKFLVFLTWRTLIPALALLTLIIILPLTFSRYLSIFPIVGVIISLFVNRKYLLLPKTTSP